MTHGSLFSGIGGFELGAQYAGIKTLWNCEIESYQRSILKKHFSKSRQYEDIKNMHKPAYVDIISGGFPCQDISLSGKGKGIKGERSGLWKEICRVIWEIRPEYIIIENSPALTIRGLEIVLCDLAEGGYDAEWKCISNSEFGFDHKRERIYIIAYPNKIFGQEGRIQGRGEIESIFIEVPKEHGGHSIAKRIYEMPDCKHIGVNDGVSNWGNRIGSIGNAVNPIVACYLFNCIIHFNNKYNGSKRNHGSGTQDADLPEESRR